MIDKIKRWGCKPHPNDESILTRLKRAAIFGLFVAGFLVFFRPFNLDSIRGWTLYQICLQFGAITFLSIVLMSILIPYFFSSFFAPQKWMVWKELLYTILNFIVIGFANSAFLYAMNYIQGGFWEVIIDLQVSTLAVGIIPVFFYIYYDQAKYFKKYALEAQKITSQIKEHPIGAEEEQLLVLKNENGEVEYQIPASQLLFVKSDGNYLELIISETETVKKHLLRNRIKNVLEEMPNIFVRCHRSYIVNLEKVRSVDGNARGYELTLANTEMKVPVSRNLADSVLSAIEQKTT
ncbi:LytTR family transcriptional regulator DNA-binding domain-containing protein [Fulvivirga lutimaris]|uniref:LytTR family transcriptional regulator DNA-binding domain-containing protein n=1 Tax=Fulvivirga lutimaris TaxID=1819566 RepID=UPI00162A2554